MAEEGEGLEALFGDEPIRPTPLWMALDRIKRWKYYDNYQHGHYVSENDPGYGPIVMFNATVKSGEEELFSGDISAKRLEYLKTLSEMYNIIFDIVAEGGKWGVLVIFEEPYYYEIVNNVMILRN